MSDCRFCDIIKGDIEDYKVWENKNFIALLDISPANPGHFMLIPKQHISDVFDLDSELYNELFSLAKRFRKPLQNITNAKRVGIAVVGFAVPHAHLHLVPLHKSNELFDPKSFKKADIEDLKSMQNKLAKELDKVE